MLPNFRENRISSLMTHLVRITVITVIAAMTCICTYYFAYFIGFQYSDGKGNAILLVDNGLYPQVLAFVVTVIVITWYLFRYPLPLSIRVSFGLAIALILVYFVWRFDELRQSQAELLVTYQTLTQAIQQGDFERGFDLMSPNYRQKHSLEDFQRDLDFYQRMDALNPADSIYNVYVDEDYAMIVADPRASIWYRPSAGVSFDVEKIGSTWYFAGKFGFFMAD